MAIDLSTVVYRAHQKGDMEPLTPPTPGNVNGTGEKYINLSGIKYRAKQFGDVEEE